MKKDITKSSSINVNALIDLMPQPHHRTRLLGSKKHLTTLLRQFDTGGRICLIALISLTTLGDIIYFKNPATHYPSILMVKRRQVVE